MTNELLAKAFELWAQRAQDNPEAFSQAITEPASYGTDAAAHFVDLLAEVSPAHMSGLAIIFQPRRSELPAREPCAEVTSEPLIAGELIGDGPVIEKQAHLIVK